MGVDFEYEVKIRVWKHYKTPPKDVQEEIMRREEDCKLEAASWLLAKRSKQEIIERLSDNCTFLDTP